MIRFENVSYRYPDGDWAVSGVSLAVGAGESVGIVGANGAGKSTLLSLLPGIRLPGQGKIWVGGVEVKKENLPAIRAKTGVVFQNPDEQLFMTTVKEDILFGPQNMGFSEQEAEGALSRMAERLQISHLLGRMPHTLSGGEKRLAAIAAVLACGPDVLLFDEPTSFLDPRARRHMIETIKGMEQTRLIATHDLDMAMEACGRVLILSRGKLAADGGVALLEDEALLKSCGLELPLCLGRRDLNALLRC